MHKLAVCFSGQGSQYVGMGLDYVEQNLEAKAFIEKASDLLKENYIDKLNDEEALSKTSEVQPLIVLKSLLGLELLGKDNYNIDAYFGFSLGEFSAYYASGIYTLDDLLKIVKVRGEVMQEASNLNPGAMAAIIGPSKEKILEVIKPISEKGILKIANENGYKQYVISGEETLVDEAILVLKENGAKRAVKLKVSGAFHTPMMADASKQFIDSVKDYKKLNVDTPMLMNLDANWLNIEDVDKHLENQMTSSVKFIDMVLKLKEEGFTHVLEIGPGKVLTGLIKKIDLDMEVQNFDSYDQYETVKGWLLENGFKK